MVSELHEKYGSPESVAIDLALVVCGRTDMDREMTRAFRYRDLEAFYAFAQYGREKYGRLVLGPYDTEIGLLGLIDTTER